MQSNILDPVLLFYEYNFTAENGIIRIEKLIAIREGYQP